MPDDDMAELKKVSQELAQRQRIQEEDFTGNLSMDPPRAAAAMLSLFEWTLHEFEHPAFDLDEDEELDADEKARHHARRTGSTIWSPGSISKLPEPDLAPPWRPRRTNRLSLCNVPATVPVLSTMTVPWLCVVPCTAPTTCAEPPWLT
jgi:hypothetical protein